MSLALFLLAAVCAVNPYRSCTATSDARIAALGAALTLGALAPFAAFAVPLLDLVSISPPTARIACGLLLVATGVLAFGTPGPDPQPALEGWKAAIVPVAFPTLLTPGLAMLTVVGSVDRSAPIALGIVAVALVTVPIVVALPRRNERVLNGLGRFTAAVLVVAGVGLLFDGVFDI